MINRPEIPLRELFRSFITKTEKVFFFLIILFLPTQFGKHFWPSFSFVQGIRIDYLSPTIFFTDILVFLLFIFFILNLIFFRRKKRGRKKLRVSLWSKLFLLFLFIFIVSAISAKSIEASTFGLIKFLEFYFLGFYVAKRFLAEDIEFFIETLSINTFLTSILAIWQFVKQESVGGFFYFFGERTFNGSTPGIANMSIDDRLVLRPYATFSHPNVLAFFLLFSNVLIFLNLLYEKETYRKIIFTFTLLISTIALFLTFSRIAIALYLIYIFYFLIKGIKEKKKTILFILLPAFVIFSLLLTQFYSRFFNFKLLTRDLFLRRDLVDIALQIFKNHPYFGIGAKNFFYYEALYQKNLSPIFLQPVHNIFLLVLVEMGIFGFLFFIAFLVKSFFNLINNYKYINNLVIKNFYLGFLLIFIAFIITSLFDHFFLTVQQGQLLLSLILGFSWLNLKKKK